MKIGTNGEYLFQNSKVPDERCETASPAAPPPMMPFSKVRQNSVKVIYRNQTAIQTFTLPAFCIFKRSNPILKLIFQNSGIFISLVNLLSLNWVKTVQSCNHTSRVIERSKSISD